MDACFQRSFLQRPVQPTHFKLLARVPQAFSLLSSANVILLSVKSKTVQIISVSMINLNSLKSGSILSYPRQRADRSDLERRSSAVMWFTEVS